jgi:hypothetical protein
VNTIASKDGTEIYFMDWGNGGPLQIDGEGRAGSPRVGVNLQHRGEQPCLMEAIHS